MDINKDVTPSLHPRCIAALPGYNDETAPAVAPATNALGVAYESLTAIHAARRAAADDPTLTDSARTLKVAAFADHHFKKIAANVDLAIGRLKVEIGQCEQTLSRPIEGSSVGGLAAEIRQHVRSLPAAERNTFLNEILSACDLKSAAAVLGAPPYLSGLSPAEHAMHLRNHHARANPDLLKRLTILRAAHEALIERSALVWNEVDKAVGLPSAQVARLRAAHEGARAKYTFSG